MKRNSILLFTLLCIATVFGSINANDISKVGDKGDNSISKIENNKIEPNANDIQKLVKPLIQTAYKPVEVDSLYQSQQVDQSLEMQKAEIVGSVARGSGAVEVNYLNYFLIF